MEVSFYDLFMSVLQRWRMLLVCLIVGAVLVGGYGFLKARNTPDLADPVQEMSREEFLVSRLSEEQRRQVEFTAARIWMDECLMEQEAVYIENSYYINLNPYQMCSCVMQYYILPEVTEQEEPKQHEMAALVTAYGSALEHVLDPETVSGYLTTGAGASDATGVVNCSLESKDSGILSVRIQVGSQEELDRLMEAVEASIEDAKKAVEALLGSHEVLYLGSDVDPWDSRILQKDRDMLRNDLQSAINNMKVLLAGVEEREYLDFLLERYARNAEALGTDAANAEAVAGAEDAAAVEAAAGAEDAVGAEAAVGAAAADGTGDMTGTETSEKAAVQTVEQVPSSGGTGHAAIRSAIKYGIVGALLGLIIAVILIIIRYVTGSKVRRAEDLEKCIQARTLGCFVGESSWTRKHHAGLDRWLLKKRNHKHPVGDYQETVSDAASNLRLIAEKNQFKNMTVYAAGCDVQSLVEDLQTNLQKNMDEQNCDLKINGIGDQTLLTDVAAQLKSTDCVVLAAQQDDTTLARVHEVVGLCNQCSLPVIGAFLME